MEIVVQVLLGLSVIGFGVLMWNSAERWTWVTLVFAPIVFIESIFVVAYLGQSMKARVAWQKVSVELEEELETALDQVEQLKYGEPGQEQIAVVPLELELEKLRIESGRVWRGLTPDANSSNAAAGEFTLRMPQGGAAAPAAPAAAPVDPNDPNAAAPAAPAAAVAGALPIPDKSVVFVFSEQVDQNQNRIPKTYLGEFEVTQSSPQSVSIKSTVPVAGFTQLQRNGIQEGQPTWAVYELMPIDGHEPFVRENSRSLPEAIFGETDEEFVNQALAGAKPETRQAYLRDGKRAQADDPPDSKWLKIEFTKNYTVRVDSDQARSAMFGGYFDTSGQATDSRLQMPSGDDGKKNGEVPFRAGDQLVVRMDAANELIGAGEAKLIDEIFVRPINDYEDRSRHFYARMNALNEKGVVLARESETLNHIKTKLVGDGTPDGGGLFYDAQNDKLKLEAELRQYRVEKAAIEKHLAELQKRKSVILAQLGALYKSNVQIARELERAQMQLKERIDRRTRTAGL